MTTSVSSYRSGSPRFGTKVTGPINSEVKTYQLSPAELEKYRNGADTKMAGKGDLEEAKRLIKETDLSANEIVERTGANKLTVKTYMQKMRFNKDSKNKKDQAPKTNKPKDVEANVTVVADYKKLMKDHEELKLKYHAIEEDRSNLEIEISQLKQELVNRNEDYLTLQEEVSELRQLQKPIKQDQYFVQDSPDNEIKLLRDSNDYLYQENLALKVRARAYKSTIRELIAEQGV